MLLPQNALYLKALSEHIEITATIDRAALQEEARRRKKSTLDDAIPFPSYIDNMVLIFHSFVVVSIESVEFAPDLLFQSNTPGNDDQMTGSYRHNGLLQAAAVIGPAHWRTYSGEYQ